GSTATGKSALAMRACERFGGEIINADSVQVFRKLDIGTAKVSPEEKSKWPHHLIDIRNPDESFTAGEFQRCALEIIKSRFQKGVKTFYVVGGSGFYIQALLKGLFPISPSDPLVRKNIEAELKEKGSE